MTTLVWFRRDLRLRDNPAFHAAVECGEAVLPVFIYAPDELAPWEPGGASRWYLHQSLLALQTDLGLRGFSLELRRGSSLDNLVELAQHYGASRVFCNRIFDA